MHQHQILPKQLLSYIAIAVLFFGLSAIFFVGFLGSDDALYWHAGARLLDGVGFPESTHFGLRYPIVVPLGFIDHIWGMTELRLTVPNYLYLVGIVVTTVLLLRELLTTRQLLIFSLLFATLPLNVVGVSIAAVDFAEAFFISLSFLLFVQAARKPGWAVPLLFSAGVALGLATLARLTAPGVLFVYGLFFVFGGFVPRRVYLFGLLGFLLPPLLEAFAYTLAGAGPFHRIDVVVGSHLTGSYQREAGVSVATDGTGNLFEGKGFVAGVAAILFNQEFALTFWAALVAIGTLLFFRKRFSRNEQVFVVCGIALFWVWFLWISLSGFVRPLPRYYLVSAWIGLVLVGAWLGAPMVGQRLRLIVVSALLAANLVALSLENLEPRVAAHVIENLVAEQESLVATDPRTEARANQRLLLTVPNKTDRLTSDPGAVAEYFVYDPAVISGIPELKERIENGVANGEWVLDSEYPLGRRLSGQLLQLVGLDVLVPARVADILLFGGEKVSVYRRGKRAEFERGSRGDAAILWTAGGLFVPRFGLRGDSDYRGDHLLL